MGEVRPLQGEPVSEQGISGLPDDHRDLEIFLASLLTVRSDAGFQIPGGLDRTMTLKDLLEAWIKAWLVSVSRVEVASEDEGPTREGNRGGRASVRIMEYLGIPSWSHLTLKYCF